TATPGRTATADHGTPRRGPPVRGRPHADGSSVGDPPPDVRPLGRVDGGADPAARAAPGTHPASLGSTGPPWPVVRRRERLTRTTTP
ncbi:hypothetical protein, partial [Cellulomonas olei]|uniref:hypothetical protein n=1 Tax=Cellulomonas sp. P4 TaxID=3142533 RepID=UPI0031BAED6A